MGSSIQSKNTLFTFCSLRYTLYNITGSVDYGHTLCASPLKKIVKDLEKLSIKWMDRPSVTEMEKGGVYKLDRQKKCQKMFMPLKCILYISVALTF